MRIIDQLYPKEISNLKVVENLFIPGFPEKDYKKNFNKDTAKEPKIDYVDFIECYSERIKYTFGSKLSLEKIALIDKTIPHSLYDFMLMDCSKAFKNNIYDYDTELQTNIYNKIYKFIKFVSQTSIIEKYNLANGNFITSYNYDPYTWDRESVMSEKRFHCHLNYYEESNIMQANQKMIRFSDIKSDIFKLRIFDPILHIGSQILFENLNICIPNVKVLKPDLSRDIKLNLPLGLKIRIPSWEFILSDSFVTMLQNIHNTFIKVYMEIYYIFTGKRDLPSDKWVRHPLLDKEQIKRDIKKCEFISDNSKKTIMCLADCLNTLDTRYMSFLKDKRKLSIKNISLNGPVYSLSMVSLDKNSLFSPLIDSSNIYISIHPRMFSDLGGAGLTKIGDVNVARVKRGKGTFSDIQCKNRTDFINDYVNFL